MLATDIQQRAFVEIEDVSEEEIHRAAMSEWVEVIAQLWDSVGKPLEEDKAQMRRFETYCKQLSNVPLGLLEIGVNYAIANNTFSVVPPVGKVFDGIRKELIEKVNPRPGMDMNEMIDLWLDYKARNIFYRFG